MAMRDTTKPRNIRPAAWRRRLMPVVIWIAAVGIAGWMFVQRSGRFEAVGLARGEIRQVAALTDGRLLMLPVGLFEKVDAGQTLAVLEDDRVKAQLSTATAEIARLRAELAATEDRLLVDVGVQESQQAAELRRFVLDLESKRLHELELAATQNTDRVRLEYLRIKRDAYAESFNKRATSELDWKAAVAEWEAMQKQIAENDRVLAQAGTDLQEAVRRHQEFVKSHPPAPTLDKALEPLRAAVTVQERKMAELSLERSMLVLRSPMDGVVSDIQRRVGEAVAPGQSILVVTAAQPSEIVAYVTASQAAQIRPGIPVELRVAGSGDHRGNAASRVVGVGPAAEQMPVRLWQSPTVPEWGWPVGISMTPELRLLSGEIVCICGL